MPNWLETLQHDLQQVTSRDATAFWPNPRTGRCYFNYRLEHVRQVHRDALKIHAKVGGDLDIILASVWLHDRFQPVFHGPLHDSEGAAWARENLARMGFPPSKVEAVAFAVGNHRTPLGKLPETAHEARVLWDADHLAHNGPLELLSQLLSTLAADSIAKLDTEIEKWPEQAFTMEALNRNLLQRNCGMELPVGCFYFETTYAIAVERVRAVGTFCEEFRAQF